MRAMITRGIAAAILASLFSMPAAAADLKGPARFCGYSPIIDLRSGEKVTTLGGGIHGGSFRWEGAFGALDVDGIGWASRPKGRMTTPPTAKKPAVFAQRRRDDRYMIAIWNGEHGAAYFSSDAPLTAAQRKAIGRVTLYNEGEKPSGCDLWTTFSWD